MSRSRRAPARLSREWSRLADKTIAPARDLGPAEIPDAASGQRYLLPFDTSGLKSTRTDVLVIGSGIAGLSAALHASHDLDVTVVTKGEVAESNTWYAQGGIAGAVGEADSVELHVADTLVVGQGLCDEDAVRAVVGEAPDALESLLGLGVRFDLAEGGGVALAREGGHSLPRVLHSGDRTGATIQNALTRTLRSRSRIPVVENAFLVDLLTEGGRCVGALLMDSRTCELSACFADAVVLASGGFGQLFRVTTNPAVATGDGIAAAWRAGAELVDLEFVQFHPTALDHAAHPRFLLSEALRGEGAHLLDAEGERFMLGVHPLAELAPRDVVSIEISRVMARTGATSVHLDARHLGDAFLRTRFPGIFEACAAAGYDLAHDLVPVAPAAHYAVGGVAVDIDGRTSLPGLYASGEVAATGLHGANRLASNSLLEGLVVSRRIARAVTAGTSGPRAAGPVASRSPELSQDPGLPAPPDVVRELQALTMSKMSMVRDDAGLRLATSGIASLVDRRPVGQDRASLECANLLTLGGLVSMPALMRTESRGCHFRSDHPTRDDDAWRGRIRLSRGGRARFVPVGTGAEDDRKRS